MDYIVVTYQLVRLKDSPLIHHVEFYKGALVFHDQLGEQPYWIASQVQVVNDLDLTSYLVQHHHHALNGQYSKVANKHIADLHGSHLTFLDWDDCVVLQNYRGKAWVAIDGLLQYFREDSEFEFPRKEPQKNNIHFISGIECHDLPNLYLLIDEDQVRETVSVARGALIHQLLPTLYLAVVTMLVHNFPLVVTKGISIALQASLVRLLDCLTGLLQLTLVFTVKFIVRGTSNCVF